MTRMFALLAALLIGGLSLKQPGGKVDAATAECGVTQARPGAARAGGQDVRCTLVAQQAAAPVERPAGPASIGMNLAAVTSYGSQVPFIDRMRAAQEFGVYWKAGGAKPYRETKLPTDAGGIPTAMPEGADHLALGVGFDPLEAGTTRRYVLLHDGTIQFFYGPGLVIVETKPGRITFTEQFESQEVAFSGTFKNVHNLHIVREDQLALFQAGKVFNPAFLDRVKLFSPVRFMDWGSTNGNMLTSWSQRLSPENYSWALNTGGGNVSSVPVEVMVQLANEAHVEPWFCIPAHADDEYVQKFASYVRDHLAPDLKPHFEYSNEVWNGGFEQAQWAAAQGKAALGLNDNAKEVFYGFRAAQVAKIVRSVMGDRARMVVGVWTTWSAAAPPVFQGIAKVGDPAKLFDEYAVTTYWGGALSGSTDKDRATVVNWAKSGQAGIDAAFDALTVRGKAALENNNDSLPGLPAIYAPHAALARQYGLDLVAYEGGFGAVAYSFGADQANVVNFFTRLQASPRMGPATAKMARDFFAAGGRELTYFNDVGSASVHGTWGTTSTIYTSSPTFEALKALSPKP